MMRTTDDDIGRIVMTGNIIVHSARDL